MSVLICLLVSVFVVCSSCPAQPPPPRRTMALEGNWTCYYANSARRAVELYCGPNEELITWGPAGCQPYCGQIDPYHNCRNISGPRCYCANGFIRESRGSMSACVLPRNCKRAIVYG